MTRHVVNSKAEVEYITDGPYTLVAVYDRNTGQCVGTTPFFSRDAAERRVALLREQQAPPNRIGKLVWFLLVTAVVGLVFKGLAALPIGIVALAFLILR